MNTGDFTMVNDGKRGSVRGIFLSILFPVLIIAQQIDIPRVEQMPNLPQPYQMRDWQQVALGYDSLVFDLGRSGDYLPLVWINTNTTNYPAHSSFGLHTVVGTPYPSNAEAINCIPAVVGASLVAIDKSNQDGRNWVLGCEEWFNRRPEENVYLNNYVSSSGDDWWYAMMPNIFFYQLYDLYPGTGDFDFQLTSVADQWLRAVQAMGGSAVPWTKPDMNYRGWYLSTMKPFTSGVKEPESAGSIAWLLYNAYLETGEEKYRLGAEWALEFLSNFANNAAYELQLPYGVYTAARMNAELGTNYDVDKMLNWCFDPEENVRQWGVTLGQWGDYDCYGLVGEALYDGYAFAMNGFEMAGALVPMLRYDDRYARAIGKWVLNLANASRLFYSPFLPDSLQDSEAWAKVYDPNGYIAHESMRETEPNWKVSPFATGDAISGGWGATNFALYGSSHVGILGAIIDTTNIPGILQLDLRATDYFQDTAYPSYLYFNPYTEDKIIEFDLGWQIVDIYDAVTNQVLVSSASGITNLTIPADGAVLAVYLPVGGTTTYELNSMLYDGIVADYNAGLAIDNYPPRIKAIAADTTAIEYGQTIDVYCTATDLDGDSLLYRWTTGSDSLAASAILTWTAPAIDTTITITCTVNDGAGATVSDSLIFTVIEVINYAPVISSIIADPEAAVILDTTSLTCTVSDANSDSLQFDWSAASGEIIGDSAIVQWVAPAFAGYYYIHCTVSDGRGGSDFDSVLVAVSDTTIVTIDDPVAWYWFSGNAADSSGLGNHGTVNGADLTTDRFGQADKAYYFNGTTDNIQVASSTSLNFQHAITVSFWMNPAYLPSNRESYPISHGNWENRWKVSILPEKKLRWTVKSSNDTKDLDSKNTVAVNTWYHVVGTYDGTNFDLYVNGSLESHTTFSGTILTTTIAMTIGQVLPNNAAYNFKGTLDEIRIYNRALSAVEVLLLYDDYADVIKERETIPQQFRLGQNYPNPFNPSTTIQYQITETGQVKLEIFDIRGRLVDTIVNKQQPAGYYTVVWNADNSGSGLYFYRLQSGNHSEVRKCIKLK